MRRPKLGLLFLCMAIWWLCEIVIAQQPPGLPTPRIQHAYPSGMKIGSSIEVNVTGQDLEEPELLLFAHPGLKAEYLEPAKETPDPKNPKKGGPGPKMLASGPHRFKITAAADVPPGLYDLRMAGKWGVSNPRAFAISDQKEVAEKEPNNDVEQAQRVELGTVISGVIATPTDVDYSSFSGKKGQRVLISCLATSIDSKATPLLEVFDNEGRKLASNRNYRDNDALVDLELPADGDYTVRVCQFTYTAGGLDYFYRLSISTAPWIDAVFPPVVEPGKATQVTLYGRNLPNGQPAEGIAIDGRTLEKATIAITPPADAVTNLTSTGRIDPVTALQDGFAYTVKGPGGISNPVMIFLARDKLTVKPEASNSPEKAKLLDKGGTVTGFLAQRDERDWIAINAVKGEKVTIDLSAERIGSIGDFYYTIRDGKDPSRIVAPEQDDDNDSLHPFTFYTRTSDPAGYTFTAPEDGKYYIVIGCRDSGAIYGPRAAYSLRIGEPMPDFRAVVMPYSRYFPTGSSAWQGGTQAYFVFAHRIDGYNGTLEVSTEGLPAGASAEPLFIGPAARWGVLVVNIAPDAAPITTSFNVKLTGTAPDGKKLARSARSASVIWSTNQPDQNIPILARLDQSLVLAIRAEKALFNLKADVPSAVIRPPMGKESKAGGPVIVLRQGEKASVPVKVEWSIPEKPNVALIAEPLLQQQQNSPVAVQIAGQATKDKADVLVNLDARNNAIPGIYSIVVRGAAQVPFVKDPMAKKGINVPAEQHCAPITIQIIPNSIAKMPQLTLPGNSLKIGTPAELVVKVDRQYDFAGEIRLTFEPPMGVTGVSAKEVTIPAGKDEATLVLMTAADAKLGTVQNATITATAVYDGKYTITQESRVSFNIVAEPKKK